ncbi:sigma-70 family RNA polymerase sigma factor [Micromonospora sp. PPF5-17]|uniref:Sigma-70 family RNA polymerase sigma factor n=2 Tax=Micromonosporaceae TaxID=28056 RepID=A0ABX9WM61_9ACTN|nr:sigma-70 family RNA polymerase sigma factor [Micromonospora sp. PPF5-17B]NES34965.1 sigma-70 family RNA polymerase sigma factor [Micromonospora solifontis]NES54703.1 sigma-70 family RNA polymerase sigma factor [Micromonospora sp. PPF5-6]RNM01556.1 sigma-70 family RNA polymerase sigma factor [Micromonospora solifontis]
MATAGTAADLEAFRVELTGYAYRMLGSGFDAEDAVQETLLRAWRGADRFDGRSSLRTWLYRIATNVCLDVLRGRGRRALPVDLGAPSAPVVESLGTPAGDWVEPVPDAAVLPADPAEVAVARESVRLAFVAALQHLPPRQRAVLILRDVLRWRAVEVAELLDASVPAVNSALQRARTTLAGVPDRSASGADLDRADRDLLDRYVDAFARYDIDALVALLRADAVQSMPPYAMWLRGAADIGRWLAGPGAECRGSRLVRITANGGPALAQYRRDPAGGHRAFSIQLLDAADSRIVRLTHFLQPDLFPRFGLPLRLE